MCEPRFSFEAVLCGVFYEDVVCSSKLRFHIC